MGFLLENIEKLMNVSADKYLFYFEIIKLELPKNQIILFSAAGPFLIRIPSFHLNLKAKYGNIMDFVF